ncbi:hypothetical protein DSO57_1004566 [Entomophthora muscae]|uniref:Uncharacterized protein n=1 Tax=Entomophthora muscae TaxID=34485 RepID=A0ACC2RZA2_9FUNG|nr:hypothetical protein DSO57_1004566 [Entomophthora muscae]
MFISVETLPLAHFFIPSSSMAMRTCKASEKVQEKNFCTAWLPSQGDIHQDTIQRKTGMAAQTGV